MLNLKSLSNDNIKGKLSILKKNLNTFSNSYYIYNKMDRTIIVTYYQLSVFKNS